jgi:tRNA pseudouridine38-40 synthase
MARVRLLISYDGTDFCGWQKQKVHECASPLPSIQETLEKALEKILRHPVKLSASGRTDAGVHAAAQVVHFDTEKTLPKDLCWALKSQLPSSIAAKQAWLAPREFHSTLSAVKKTYRYWIWNHPRPTALLARYSWWIRAPLELEYLHECSQYLLSLQDFASFRSMGTPVKHTHREIYQAEWAWLRPNLLQFEVTGNGFMKQMVRNIVGTMVDLSLKDQPSEKMKTILEAKDRQKAGPTAPPQGLFLRRVYYPKELDKRCRRI